MRVYWELARQGFRRYATYRAATVAGIFTNCAFGLFRASILIALFRYRRDLGGYDVTDAITYTWLTQGLIMVIWLWAWGELAQRVRTGDVVTDLSRPVDFQGLYLSQDLGRAAYHFATRAVAPFLVGAVLFSVRTPAGLAAWAAFFVSLTLAIVVSFALRFAVNLVAFWIVDARGVRMAYGLLLNFLSGFILPVRFFPGWLRTLAYCTPFPSLIQVPVDVFLGKVHGASLLGALAVQAAWAAVLLAVGRRVMRAGFRHLVVQGG